jgi:hypothetical protein
MGLVNKLKKRQLRSMGIDVDNKNSIANATIRTIKNLVETSVPSVIKPLEMRNLLQKMVDKLEQEYQI